MGCPVARRELRRAYVVPRPGGGSSFDRYYGIVIGDRAGNPRYHPPARRSQGIRSSNLLVLVALGGDGTLIVASLTGLEGWSGRNETPSAGRCSLPGTTCIESSGVRSSSVVRHFPDGNSQLGHPDCSTIG